MAIFSLLADAASPSPIDTDLGKLVIGLAFLFLVADRVITLVFKLVPSKAKEKEDSTYATKAELKDYVLKAEQNAMLDRLERRIEKVATDQVEHTKYLNARYEDLNRQNNEMRLVIEQQRREAIELNHRAVAEVIKKIEDVDFQNRVMIQAAFESSGIKVPAAFATRGAK